MLDDSDVAALFGLEMTETAHIDAPAPTTPKLPPRSKTPSKKPAQSRSPAVKKRNPSRIARDQARASSRSAAFLIPLGWISWNESMRGQARLFDVDNRLKRLTDLGDQREAFRPPVNFELFRPELNAALDYSDGAQGG